MSELIRKMKSELDKGVVTASVTSSTMLEVAKLNTFISGLKTTRTGLTQQLGELVYGIEMNICADEKDEKTTLIGQIADIDIKIRERESQIEKLNNEKAEILAGISRNSASGQSSATVSGSGTACVVCGAQLKETMKFCGGCGSPMDVAMPPKQYNDSKCEACCSSCGAILKEGAKFCGKCGFTTLNPVSTETELCTLEQTPVPVGRFCNCGALLKDGVKFCGKCGGPVLESSFPTEVLTTDNETVSDTRYCNCGEIIRVGAAFCKKCGAALVD